MSKQQSFTATSIAAALLLTGVAHAQTNEIPIAMITSPTAITVMSGESVTLSGSGTDADGTIAGFAWNRFDVRDSLLGLSLRDLTDIGYAFTGEDTANAMVTAPTVTANGTIVFNFRVQDDDGAFSTFGTENVTLTITPVMAEMPVEMTMMPVTTPTDPVTPDPVTPVVTPAETPAAAAPARRSSSNSGDGDLLVFAGMIGIAALAATYHPDSPLTYALVPTGRHSIAAHLGYRWNNGVSANFRVHQNGLDVDSQIGEDAINTTSMLTLQYTW